MRVSVIIPLYNKAPYLRRTLDAVVGQDFRAHEIIVVDDGSTDSGAEIAARYPGVRLVRQANAGVGAARNRGIREAQGDLVAFLDADDVWLPTYLRAQVALAAAFPAAGLYATGYQVIYAHGVKTVTVTPPTPDAERWLLSHYFRLETRAQVVTSSSAVVPRQVLMATGGFVEGEPWGEDRDLWGRIALRWPVAYCRQPLVRYHCEITGRASTRRLSRVPVPPFIRSAIEALAGGGLLDEQHDDLVGYVNSLWVLHAQRLLAAGEASAARHVLEDLLLPGPTPVQARWLRLALRLLPARGAALLDRLTRTRLTLAPVRRGDITIAYTSHRQALDH